jgi:hypothetical protein
MKIYGIDYKYLAMEYLKARDGNMCKICDEPISGNVDIDHIIPIKDGGSNDASNIRVVHTECHKLRHAQMQAKRPIPLDKRFYTGRTGKALSNARRFIVMDIAPRIIAEREKGKGMARIAREWKISRPTIYEYLKRYELIKNDTGG